MINSVVFVKNAFRDGLLKACAEWIELYKKDLPDNFKLELSKIEGNDFIIAVAPEPGNEQFIYFVNYLRWARNIGGEVDVEGYTVARDPEWFPGQYLNKDVLVYVSPDDEEGDNVNVVSDNNDVYNVDFAFHEDVSKKFRKEKRGKTYQRPITVYNFEPVKTFRANPGKPVAKEVEEPERTGKRFWMGTGILVVLVATAFVVSIFTRDNLRYWIMMIDLAVGMWFLVDNELLQHNRIYMCCVGVSLLIVALGFFTRDHIGDEHLTLNDMASFSPFSMLIVQWPLRRLFLKVFDQEPAFERPNPGGFIPNYIYSVILIFSMIILPRIFL